MKKQPLSQVPDKLPPNPMFLPKVTPAEAMCERCPFKSDGSGYAVDHPDFPQIVAQVAMGLPFMCHETVIMDKRTTMTYDPAAREPVPYPAHQPHFRHCLGAVLYKRGQLSLPKAKPIEKKRRRK